MSLLGNLAWAQTLPAPAVPQPPPLAQPSLAPGGLPAPITAQPQPIPAARWTPELVGQSFELADSNSDGQLTRAEALRLTIQPRSFEDMDQNKNGVLERAEYENQFAR